MSNEQCRAMAVKALQNMRGDNLYRAQWAFKGMTPEQMKEQYGQSGRTRAEILAEYEAHDKSVSEAINWVNMQREVRAEFATRGPVLSDEEITVLKQLRLEQPDTFHGAHRAATIRNLLERAKR